MKQAIGYVALVVRDYDEAIEFYVGKLGFHLVEDTIIEAQHAKTILENGQADLIAVGRQSRYNPNIAHRWAHDLGINARFEDWASEHGWWPEKRIRTMDGFATPTRAVIRRA